MYSAEYFDRDFRCGRSDATSTDEAAFRAENDGLLDRFESWRGGARLPPGGSPAGVLLKRARERGWHCVGVELSPEAVARARALGLDVRQGTLEDAAIADAAFDVVYMGDVLEHVPNCRATLAGVARVLVPGGHAVVRGPITTHSLARRAGLALYGALGRSIVLREPPYHLWEFRPASLARLARATPASVARQLGTCSRTSPMYTTSNAASAIAASSSVPWRTSSPGARARPTASGETSPQTQCQPRSRARFKSSPAAEPTSRSRDPPRHDSKRSRRPSFSARNAASSVEVASLRPQRKSRSK